MAWYDEPDTGTLGMASNVPTNEWFPVNTTTGEWGRPTPTPPPASTLGDLGLGLDLTSPFPMQGQGDGGLLPGTPTIGQVAGPWPAPVPTARALAPRPSLDALGTVPQPTVWESIARGIGMLSPQGRSILQGYDQQQQQQLTNRLALRRQALLEDQEARNAVKEEYTAFTDMSKIKNKALRNLQFDRLVARAAEAGRPLPADFVEAFKKSSLVEGEGIAQAYGHLLKQTGFSDAQVAQILEAGDPETIKGLLEGSLKVQKQQWEQEGAAAFQADLATLGGASGITQPAPTPGIDQRPRGYVEGQTTQPILGSETLSPSFLTKSKDVADRLGMNHQDFLRIMAFETGGTFNPAEKNRAGSGATGLIQFTEQTAKALGTTTAALAKMSPEEQLDYVEKYLTPYKGKLGSFKDAYLAVLKPAAIGQSLDTPLFTRDKDPLAYRQNAGLDAAGKGVVTVGDALGAVMRTTTGGGTLPQAPDTRMQVAGPGAPAPTLTAADQREVQQLNRQIEYADQMLRKYGASSNEAVKAGVTNLQSQRDDWVKRRDQLTEPQRAFEREKALQPLKLEQQRAGAEVTLEAKMNEPIGPETAIKMGLDPQTKWKDVPKGTRVLDRPGEGVSKDLGAFKASYEGLTRVIGMLDQPGAKSIIGTLFSSEDNAAFRRLAGQWISSVTPAERKFAAALVAEIAGIRNTISGQAVSAQEAEFLKPMLPSVSDPDIETVRAKLEVLQEWIARKHEGARSQLDELGFRTPKALERPAEAPKPGANVERFKKALE